MLENSKTFRLTLLGNPDNPQGFTLPDQNIGLLNVERQIRKPLESLASGSPDPDGALQNFDTAMMFNHYLGMDMGSAMKLAEIGAASSITGIDYEGKNYGQALKSTLQNSWNQEMKGITTSLYQMSGDIKFLRMAEDYDTEIRQNPVTKEYGKLGNLSLDSVQPLMSAAKFAITTALMSWLPAGLALKTGAKGLQALAKAGGIGSQAVNFLSAGYSQAGNILYDVMNTEDLNGNKLPWDSTAGTLLFHALALTSGAVELVSFNNLPFFKALNKSFTNKELSSLLKTGFVNGIRNYAFEAAKSTGAEASEEGIQYIIQAGYENALKAMANKEGSDFTLDSVPEVLDEAVKQTIEAAKSMILTSMITGGLGQGLYTIQHKRLSAESEKIFKKVKGSVSVSPDMINVKGKVINDSVSKKESSTDEDPATEPEKMDPIRVVNAGARLIPINNEEARKVADARARGAKGIETIVEDMREMDASDVETLMNQAALASGGKLSKSGDEIVYESVGDVARAVEILQDSVESVRKENGSYQVLIRDLDGELSQINLRVAGEEETLKDPDYVYADDIDAPHSLSRMAQGRALEWEERQLVKGKLSRMIDHSGGRVSRNDLEANVDAVILVANTLNIPTDELLEKNVLISFEEFVKDDKGNDTDARGSITQTGERQYTIHISKTADVSTIIHELGHTLRGLASQEQLADFKKHYGIDGLEAGFLDDIVFENGKYRVGGQEFATEAEAKQYATAVEERFADDFVAYLMTGQAPTTELKNIFGRMKDVLTKLFREFRDRLTPEVRQSFDRLISGQTQASNAIPGLPNEGDVPLDADGNVLFQESLEESVRTPEFKEWFGDWEKAVRIEHLKNAQVIQLDGNAHVGKYELNSKSSKKYIQEKFQSETGPFINLDTGDEIFIGRSGRNKVTSHGRYDDIHLKTIHYIPDLIENSVFVAEMSPTRENSHFDKYRYYVAGIEMDDQNFTVKIVVGEKDRKLYYDHGLTDIEKGNLIERLRIKLPGGQSNSLSQVKDTKLIEILQDDSSKVVDSEGFPLVVYHGGIEGVEIFRNSGVRAGEFLTEEARKKLVNVNFFAKNRSVAESYKRKIDDRAYRYSDPLGAIYEVFLSIKNPLVIDMKGKPYDPGQVEGQIENAVKAGHDGMIIENVVDDFNQQGKPTTVYAPFTSEQIKSVNNRGTWDPHNPNILYQTAVWHGSPHYVDRFSTDYIGTGEGNQAFGWGLYFTSRREIARHYAKQLSKKNLNYSPLKFNKIELSNELFGTDDVDYDQLLADLEDDMHIAIDLADTADEDGNDYEAQKLYALADAYESARNDVESGLDGFSGRIPSILARYISPDSLNLSEDDMKYFAFVYDIMSTMDDTSISTVRDLVGNPMMYDTEKIFMATGVSAEEFFTPEETLIWFDENISLFEFPEKPGRNLYRVTLNKDKDSSEYSWLGWYETISSEQRQKIADKALDEGVNITYEENGKAVLNTSRFTTGEQLYHELEKSFVLGSPKEASLFLLRAGFDGIRYPAQSISRRRTQVQDPAHLAAAKSFREYGSSAPEALKGMKEAYPDADIRSLQAAINEVYIDRTNYVVFDENTVTIEERTLFQLSPKARKELAEKRHDDVQAAVAEMFYVPLAILQEYAGEEWADKEIELRKHLAKFPWILEEARMHPDEEAFFNHLQEKTELGDFKWSVEDELWYARVFAYSRIMTPKDRDKQFLRMHTATDRDLIELGRMLKGYRDVGTKSNKTRKGYSEYVQYHWGSFKGVSTKVKSLSGLSTKEELQEARRLIEANPRAYRKALNIVLEAEDRVQAMKAGDQYGHGQYARDNYFDNLGEEIEEELEGSKIGEMTDSELAKFFRETEDREERAEARDRLATRAGVLAMERQLERELKDLGIENEKSTNKIKKELKEAQSKNAEIQKRLDSANEDYRSAQKTYEDEVRKTKSLQGESDRKSSTIEKLRTDINDRREKIKDLGKQLTESRLRVKALSSQVDILKKRENNRRVKKDLERLHAFLRKRVKFNPDVVDASYQEAMDIVYDLLDENQKQGKYELIPDKLRAYIDDEALGYIQRGRNISRWTKEDLLKLIDAVELMRMDAKLMLEQKKLMRSSMLQSYVMSYYRQTYGEDAEVTVGYGSIVPQILKELGEKRSRYSESGWDSVKNTVLGAIIHSQRLARLIDGDLSDGVMTNLLVRKVYKQMTAETENTLRRLEPAEKKMKELGLTSAALSNDFFTYTTMSGDKIHLTLGQTIGLYVYSQNSISSEKLQHASGNGISFPQLADAITKLSDNQKAWGDYMIDSLGGDETWERMAKVYYEVYNKNLGRRDRYFTFVADGAQDEGNMDIINGAMRDSLRWVDKGMTKEVNIYATYPLKLDVTSTFMSQVKRQEHFIEWAAWLRDMNYLFERGGIGKMIDMNYGPKIKKQVLNFIKDIGSPQTILEDIERLGNKILSNASVAMLSLNALTMLKQLPSFASAFRDEVDMRDFLVASMSLSNPVKHKELMEFIYEKSPLMKKRQISIELAQYENENFSNPVWRASKKFNDKFGMKGIQMMDHIVVSTLWLARYNTFIRNNRDTYQTQSQLEDEAAFQATNFIQETQPSSLGSDTSSLQKNRSPWVRAFLMFSNQIFQYMNMALIDIPAAWRTKDIKHMMGLVANLTISGGLIILTTGAFFRGDGEDDEEWLKRILKEVEKMVVTYTVPFVGNEVASGIDGWSSGSGLIQLPFNIGRLIGEINDGDWDKVVDRAWDVGGDLGTVSGMPSVFVNRVVKSVREDNQFYLLNKTYGELWGGRK